MSAKLTPEPWTYGVRPDGSIWLSLGDHKTGAHHQGDLVATEDDARLIVAAPKLLAALRDYMSAVNMMNMALKDGVNVHGAISGLIGAEDNANSAIAEATGGES